MADRGTRQALEGLLFRNSYHAGSYYRLQARTGWLRSLTELLDINGIVFRGGTSFGSELVGQRISIGPVDYEIRGWNWNQAICRPYSSRVLHHHRAARNVGRIAGPLVSVDWDTLGIQPQGVFRALPSMTLEGVTCSDGSWTSRDSAGIGIVSTGGPQKFFTRGIPQAPERAFAQEALGLAVTLCMASVRRPVHPVSIFTDCKSAIEVIRGNRLNKQSTAHQLLMSCRPFLRFVQLDWVKAHVTPSDEAQVANYLADRVADGRDKADDITSLVCNILDQPGLWYLAQDDFPANYHSRTFSLNSGVRYYSERSCRAQARGSPTPTAEEVSIILQGADTLVQKAAVLKLVLGKFDDERRFFQGDFPTCGCGCRGTLVDWCSVCTLPVMVTIRSLHRQRVTEYLAKVLPGRTLPFDDHLVWRGIISSYVSGWSFPDGSEVSITHELRRMLTTAAFELRAASAGSEIVSEVGGVDGSSQIPITAFFGRPSPTAEGTGNSEGSLSQHPESQSTRPKDTLQVINTGKRRGSAGPPRQTSPAGKRSRIDSSQSSLHDFFQISSSTPESRRISLLASSRKRKANSFLGIQLATG